MSALGPQDARRTMPRLYEQNFPHNALLLNKLQKIAEVKGCTLAQLSLAWILHQGESFVPIPSTYQIPHLEENAGAADIVLSSGELAEIDTIFPPQRERNWALEEYISLL